MRDQIWSVASTNFRFMLLNSNRIYEIILPLLGGGVLLKTEIQIRLNIYFYSIKINILFSINLVIKLYTIYQIYYMITNKLGELLCN